MICIKCIAEQVRRPIALNGCSGSHCLKFFAAIPVRLAGTKMQILAISAGCSVKAPLLQEPLGMISEIDRENSSSKSITLRPLYNTQLMTDCGSEVIIAFGVWSQANDHGTLVPMIEKTQRATGGRLRTVYADSGYCSILDLQDCASLNIDLYAPVQDNTNQPGRKSGSGASQIPAREFKFDKSTRELTCPAGHAMKLVREVQVPRADGRCVGELRYEQSVQHCSGCPLASRCLGGKAQRRTVSRQSDQAILDAQKQKLQSPAGKRSQRLRGQVIERRFGDGKKHRGQGIQNGRGLARVKAEVGLLVVAQNTLTLWLLENRRKNVVT